MKAGHGVGHLDVANRLTWKQIEAFWRADEASRARDLSTSLSALLVNSPPKKDG